MAAAQSRPAGSDLLVHLRRARDHIDRHYAEPLDLHVLAAVAGFASLGSFSSRFRELVGESPSAYRDRWATRGAAHVPRCFRFMRGVLDLGGTAGSAPGGNRAI